MLAKTFIVSLLAVGALAAAVPPAPTESEEFLPYIPDDAENTADTVDKRYVYCPAPNYRCHGLCFLNTMSCCQNLFGKGMLRVATLTAQCTVAPVAPTARHWTLRQIATP